MSDVSWWLMGALAVLSLIAAYAAGHWQGWSAGYTYYHRNHFRLHRGAEGPGPIGKHYNCQHAQVTWYHTKPGGEVGGWKCDACGLIRPLALIVQDDERENNAK